MMHFSKKPYSVAALVFAVLFVGTLIVQKGLAWTNPGSNPPFATPTISTLNGRLGIGTGAPTSPLSVIGNSTSPTIYSSGASTGAAIYGVNTGSNAGLYGESSNSFGVYGTGSTGGYFTGGTYALLTGAGNVGVGTMTPGYKLDVNGDANATRLCIAGICQGSWPVASATTWAAVTSKSLGDTARNDSTLDIGTSQYMRWKNYGNGHVIIDASNSTAPNGSAINNTNSQVPWAATYPTLMGWNGGNTYGVRVDSARVADSASSVAFVNSLDGDRNAATKLPTTSAQGVRFDFVGSGSAGTGGNYAGVMTYAPWTGTTGSTGDASYQLAFGSTAINGGGVPQLNIRKGIDSTWGTWKKIITDDGSGNVGIGTASPQINLQVRSDGLGTWQGRMGLANATADKQVFFGTYGSNAGVFSHNNALSAWAPLYVNSVDGVTGGNVIMSGNVGIGTVTPGGPLDVNGRASASSFKVSSSFADLANNSPWYGIGVPNFLGANGSNPVQLAGYGGVYMISAGGSMTLSSNGNVGIGNTTPGYKLDVNGSINRIGNIWLDADGNRAINWADSQLVMTAALGGATSCTLATCDIDKNGVINISDAQILLQYVVGSRSRTDLPFDSQALLSGTLGQNSCYYTAGTCAVGQYVAGISGGSVLCCNP